MLRQLPTDMAAQQALLSSMDRQLPPEAHQECGGPDEGITLAELHSALEAPTCGKKPGSYGMSYEFRTQFWDLLGPELLAAFLQKSAYRQPASLHDPGGHHPAVQGQGRPTLFGLGTLLNSDYKLLAKAPATRLGPALQHVSDPTHTAKSHFVF